MFTIERKCGGKYGDESSSNTIEYWNIFPRASSIPRTSCSAKQVHVTACDTTCGGVHEEELMQQQYSANEKHRASVDMTAPHAPG